MERGARPWDHLARRIFGAIFGISSVELEKEKLRQKVFSAGKSKHVPYRNSKLTNPLADSLGGVVFSTWVCLPN